MCRHNPIDLQDLPDRLVLLNEQYALARYHDPHQLIISSPSLSTLSDEISVK
jgi:hypothetical protein